jgi:lipopolysaccharide/colanic/teichoic acid biosynthesis glycosyltransferase
MTAGKRICDALVSLVAIVILSPVLLCAGTLVWLYDRGPVFFCQERVGRGGRPFVLRKIRSMQVDSDRDGPPITSAGDRRVTPVGRWLRLLKIDELPQFLNVLAGEMSLVGPRPEVAQYVSLYSPAQRAVLELTPGLTDPASIAYRNEEEVLARAEDPERYYVEVVMPRKIEMNLEYARNANIWTDVVILLRTAVAVLKGL